MNSILQTARHWHARYVHVLSWLQHPFLLACRLYWGGLFVSTGFGKLTHLALTAQRFADWHIPAPYANAVAAGTTELLCGSPVGAGRGIPDRDRPAHRDDDCRLSHCARRRGHGPLHVCHRSAVLAPVHLHARAAVRAGSVLDRLSGRQIYLRLVLRFAIEPGCEVVNRRPLELSPKDLQKGTQS